MDTQVVSPMQENTSHPFWQHFSKRTALLIVILLGITAGLMYLAIRQEQPQPKTAQLAAPTPSPAHTTLTLVPETSSASALQIVDVVADSSTNRLTGAQLNMAFDPQVLTDVSIKPGTYFINPMILYNNIDAANGRITYVLAINPNGTQASGSGVVATISYTLLSTAHTTTTLSFLPKTEVTQQGVLGSVLKSTKDLLIPIPATLQISPAAK